MTSRAGIPSDDRPNASMNAGLPCMIRWAGP